MADDKKDPISTVDLLLERQRELNRERERGLMTAEDLNQTLAATVSDLGKTKSVTVEINKNFRILAKDAQSLQANEQGTLNLSRKQLNTLKRLFLMITLTALTRQTELKNTA